MKTFNYAQDNAYVVPALRTRGATNPLWTRKGAIVSAVLLAHGALLYMALKMVTQTPPEALPMAETEVILEQISNDNAAPTPIIRVPQPVQPVQHSASATNDVQKTIDDSEMARTVKQTQTTTTPITPPTETIKRTDAPAVKAMPTPQPTVAQPTAPAAASVPAPASKPQAAPVPPAPKAAEAPVHSSGGSAKGVGISFNPKPPYPKTLESAGVGGTVGLFIHVSSEGRATSVAVTKSSGQSALDESARQTVLSRWKFKPAKNADGDAIAGTSSQSIRFTPQDSSN